MTQHASRQWHADPDSPGRHTHCDEFETDVTDGQHMLELYRAIGFTDEIKVEKIRRIYNYADFEIVVDNVTDLGIFVEVELTKPVSDPKAGLATIRTLLKAIGINSYKEQTRGYVSMHWNPTIDFGEDIVL